MNQIREFNDELGYLVVEPGVSFSQAAEFLRERKSKHFLSVIGGPPDASVVGNLVERGDGTGPLGDRVEHACGLEVVLGTGDVVRTGFSQYPKSRLEHLHKAGVGPSFDGLFTQSNLGIVTKATLWLNPIPEHFQAFFFRLSSCDQLAAVTPKLRELQQQRVIAPNSSVIWNAYKMVAVLGQHPDPTSSQLDVQQLLARLSPRFAGTEWMGFGGIYSGSTSIAKAQKAAVKKAISPECSGLTFVDRRKYRLLQFANRICNLLGAPPLIDPKALDALFGKPAYLGYPSDRNLRSVYWRKPSEAPDTIDPHRDRCGLVWLCHAVPHEPTAIADALAISESTIKRFGLEPNLALQFKTERCVHIAIQISYDRDIAGQDEKAISCRQEVEQKLNRKGFLAYRLGIDSMGLLPSLDTPTGELLRKLKDLCDPKGILAPGRYSSGNRLDD